jgi:hypothetical protein
MTVRTNSADLPPLVSRSAAWAAFRKALRQYVGRGRHYSVKQLSNATGVKDRVIECAMCEMDDSEWRAMPFEAQLSVAAFLGADFTSEWLALALQGAFALPDTDDTPPGELAADNSDDNATLVRSALDGKFDASEKPELRVVATRMVERGMKLRAMAA